MQELRLVAVSEDGSYAILAVPGEAEVPAAYRRPAEDGGQGSVLPARAVRDRSGESVATQGDPGPHPGWRDGGRDRRRAASRRTGCAASRVPCSPSASTGPRKRSAGARAQRVRPWPPPGRYRRRAAAGVGATADNAEWDSRKRPDGNWQVRLQFPLAAARVGRVGIRPAPPAVIPDEDQAVRLCLPQEEWAAGDVRRAGEGDGNGHVDRCPAARPVRRSAREQERRVAAAPPRPWDADFAGIRG